MKNRNFSARSMVPVTIHGATVMIDANSISDWRKHHGTTAAGVKVNSLSTKQIGDSTVIGAGRGKLSVLTDELEVVSVDLLTDLGYTVTAPAKSA
jgi:hypothetical protein